MRIERLVSGGQTGADIAALDVALCHDFPHGGWCPKGRRSLDGRIPDLYRLQEIPKSSYLQRTEWNVRDSDGTLVFTFSSEPTGGSLKTIEFARKHRKPFLHISKACDRPEEMIRDFIEAHAIKTLKVAGSRESKDPGVHQWVLSVCQPRCSLTTARTNGSRSSNGFRHQVVAARSLFLAS